MRYSFHEGQEAQKWVKWASERIAGCERGWTECVAMRVYGDETAGVVVFHDYNPEAQTMCMSAAGKPGWLTRQTLYAMHSYIFNDAACQLAVLQTSENNRTMQRIAKAYGYNPFRIPRLRGRHEAEIIWTLTDDDWRQSRFHKKVNHGKT